MPVVAPLIVGVLMISRCHYYYQACTHIYPNGDIEVALTSSSAEDQLKHILEKARLAAVTSEVLDIGPHTQAPSNLDFPLLSSAFFLNKRGAFI